MRTFLIFATIFVVAFARPDIGLKLREQQGYDYQNPGHSAGGSSSGGSSYNGGQPSDRGSNFGSNGGSNGGFGGSNGGSNGGFGGSNGGFGGSNGGSSGGFGGSNGGSSGGFGGSNGGSSGGFGGSNGGSRGGFGGSSSGFGGSSGGFGGSSGGFGGSGGDVTQGKSEVIDISGSSSGNGGVVYKPVVKIGEPIITKHFYVHEAPEEKSAQVQEKVVNYRPKTNYKIIFIKAPSTDSSYGGSRAPVYPQDEEKTIVYVLSKKNDEVGENGEIPTPPPAVTSKPEVFFVKYKTKQEADQAVSKIQESFQEGGPGYNSPSSFSKNLGATSGSSNAFSSGSRTGSDNLDVRADNGFSGSDAGFGASDSGFGGSSAGFGASDSGFGGSDSGFGGSSSGFGGSSAGFGESNSGFSGSSGGFGSAPVSSSSGHSGVHSGVHSGGHSGGHDQSFAIEQQMLEIPFEDSAFGNGFSSNEKKRFTQG